MGVSKDVIKQCLISKPRGTGLEVADIDYKFTLNTLLFTLTI